jgi:ubiquinone biosynthesis protein COQ9
MPPTKLKKSVSTYSKSTGKKTIEHFYIKNASDKELEEMKANDYTKPKVKQKISNEMFKRVDKFLKAGSYQRLLKKF